MMDVLPALTSFPSRRVSERKLNQEQRRSLRTHPRIPLQGVLFQRFMSSETVRAACKLDNQARSLGREKGGSAKQKSMSMSIGEGWSRSAGGVSDLWGFLYVCVCVKTGTLAMKRRDINNIQPQSSTCPRHGRLTVLVPRTT